jgi:hypothetical protein
MTPAQAQRFLSRIFNSLFDPAQTAEQTGRHFAGDYQQHADGKVLDHALFVEHARTLKATLKSASVSFEKVIACGQSLASVHIVDAIKHDGQRLKVKVVALYEVEDGLIRRVDELSHLLEGEASDRDLGTRHQ